MLQLLGILANSATYTAMLSGITILCFTASYAVALAIGAGVSIPGWSSELARASIESLLLIALLLLLLMPLVAFFASAGRGYLPALGWALLTVILAQIVSVLGWGDWFPWAVPVLASGMVGPRAELLGLHSYLAALLVFVAGTAATFIWWRSADQAQ